MLPIDSSGPTLTETRTLLLVGIAEIALGTILSLIASIGSVFSVPIALSLVGVLSGVGVGLIAAGVLTTTVEVINRYRSATQLAAIRRADVETLLTGLIPKPVFEAIRSQIIQQPFFRTNYHTTLNLEWRTTDNTKIVKTEVSVWDVENLSLVPQVYDLRVGESNDSFDNMPDEVSISYVKVERADGKTTRFEGDELASRIIREAKFLRFELPLSLASKERVKILVKTSNIFECRDVFNLHITGPAVNMKLNVTHPQNLLVDAYAMHPSRDLLVQEMDTQTTKQWRFEVGFLPFQGVKIIWAPAAKRILEGA